MMQALFEERKGRQGVEIVHWSLSFLCSFLHFISSTFITTSPFPSKNKLGDEGASHIARLIASNSSIKMLFLWYVWERKKKEWNDWKKSEKPANEKTTITKVESSFSLPQRVNELMNMKWLLKVDFFWFFLFSFSLILLHIRSWNWRWQGLWSWRKGMWASLLGSSIQQHSDMAVVVPVSCEHSTHIHVLNSFGNDFGDVCGRCDVVWCFFELSWKPQNIDWHVSSPFLSWFIFSLPCFALVFLYNDCCGLSPRFNSDAISPMMMIPIPRPVTTALRNLLGNLETWWKNS